MTPWIPFSLATLCLTVWLAEAPAAEPRYFHAPQSADVVLRGQSPGQPTLSDPFAPQLGAPGLNAPGGQPTFAPNSGIYAPNQGVALPDPFLAGPQTDPFASPGVFGVNGPQPYRFGLTPRFDFGYIPQSKTDSPDVGSLEVVEYGAELAYTRPVGSDWIFTSTPQFGARSYEGPDAVDLPGSVFRLGWNLELASIPQGPWSWQLGFNPSINTDFEHQLTSDAWNFDGQAVVTYQADPQLLFVAGVMYWDRVDDIVLPTGGVVWTPTDRWELRLLFPKSRISYFLGRLLNENHWLYASAEYHVESYQIETSVLNREQVQLEDWRAMVGIRSESDYYTKYIEAGYIFERDVDFRNSTTDFAIDEGLVVRAGIKF